jgi:hypothetical protein
VRTGTRLGTPQIKRLIAKLSVQSSERLTLGIVDQLKYIGGRGVKASFFPVANFLNDVVLSTSVKYAEQQGHIVGFRGLF